MCGILGVYTSTKKQAFSKSAFLHLRDTMTSRGPDAAGYYAHQNLQLGHRRLAIRDLDHGQQPWISPSGRFVLIYNGELYNDHELRQQLSNQHYHFKTRCDTETLLAGYEVWGTEVFRKINGMFACLIYDHLKQEIVVARDPLGIKPLFYAYVQGSLIVASTIKAILGHPLVSRNYDWSAISHYLSTFRLTLGERTLYQDIRQLQPGYLLTFNNEQLTLCKYAEKFTTHKHHGGQQISHQTAQEMVDAAISTAVKSQLQSDVKVGLFLSGGLDSTLIANYQKQLSSESVHSLFIQGEQSAHATSRVIKYPSGKFHRIDNKDHKYQQNILSEHGEHPLTDQIVAGLCAQKHDFTHHELIASGQDYMRLWKHLIKETSLPLTTPSDPLIYLMSLHARQHVGVVLGGEGADEFFLGYQTIQPKGHDFDLLQLYCEIDPEMKSIATKNFVQQFQQQYGYHAQHSLARFYFQIASSISPEHKSTLLRDEFVQQTQNDQDLWAYYEQILSDHTGITGISSLLQQVNLESLLSRLDTNTMLAGLEARVPYTDLNLIRLAAELPLSYKLSINSQGRPQFASSLEQQGLIKSKTILRTLADKYYPTTWNHRPKGSFPTPVFDWIRDSWWEEVQQLLTRNQLLQEIFISDELEQLLSSPTSAGPILWALINLAFWDESQRIPEQRFSVDRQHSLSTV